MIKKVIEYIANLWYIIIDNKGSDSMSNTVDVLDVAKTLICKFNNAGKDITQLKLQKLLYFIESYYMATYDKDKLYNEEFYAWTYGPVCKEVYIKYKFFADTPIYEQECEKICEFNSNVVDSINDVYDLFGDLTSTQLIKLTHMKGSPWYELPIDFDTVISKNNTKKWFKEVFLNNVNE